MATHGYKSCSTALTLQITWIAVLEWFFNSQIGDMSETILNMLYFEWLNGSSLNPDKSEAIVINTANGQTVEDAVAI